VSAFGVIEGSNFVVGAAELKRADRLKALRFQEEFAAVMREQRRAGGYAVQALLGEQDVVESDHLTGFTFQVSRYQDFGACVDLLNMKRET
jgi:hypothetical protein